jgi:UDP-glucuronate decarboxylase
MNSDCSEPVNLGSEHEMTIKECAELTLDVVQETLDEWEAELAERGGGGETRLVPNWNRAPPLPAATPPPRKSKLVYSQRPSDDPQRRRADITRAREKLGWEPRWPVRAGIKEVAKYFLLQQ